MRETGKRKDYLKRFKERLGLSGIGSVSVSTRICIEKVATYCPHSPYPTFEGVGEMQSDKSSHFLAIHHRLGGANKCHKQNKE